jgi:8-oxo-dGTP pyrophosphatase MutT (NUDIX family)
MQSTTDTDETICLQNLLALSLEPQTKKQKRCGVIYMHIDNFNQVWFLLVRGKRMGHLSFPKGSKNGLESDKECALRELREETWIVEDPDLLSQYVNINGNTYFTLVSKTKFSLDQSKIEDKNEVASVEWLSIQDIHLDSKCNKDVRRWIQRISNFNCPE